MLLSLQAPIYSTALQVLGIILLCLGLLRIVGLIWRSSNTVYSKWRKGSLYQRKTNLKHNLRQQHTFYHIIFYHSDLNELIKVLNSLDFTDSKWSELGLNLGIPQPKLDGIEKDQWYVQPCLKQCLTIWLKSHPPCTWSKLVEAL